MKIYNKKGWVLGMGEILLGIVGVCIYVQTGFQTFDWKAGTLLILLFSFGVSGIVRSCSKEASREDRITQRDERNQYIALGSGHVPSKPAETRISSGRLLSGM